MTLFRLAVRPVFIGKAQSVFTPAPYVPPSSFSIWNRSGPYYTSDGAQDALTLATQFSLSRDCVLSGIWWYSQPDATVLPVTCGIWDIPSQGLVTVDAAPAWVLPDGAVAEAGQGWVFDDFSAAGVVLPAGENYYVAVYQGESGVTWWCTAADYWTAASGLPGENGITSGPITAPDTEASVSGQGCYATVQWQFPDTDPGNGEVFYADVEVTPLGG